MEPADKFINILLLGESGSGKSTFINSLANYLRYPTLEEAMQNTPECLISTYFTMTDENYDDKEVSLEQHASTLYSSSIVNGDTQDYIFHVGENNLCVIDTPAIGDAKGIEQDKKNLTKIVAKLSRYTHLNAIIFLLKSNVTIINEYFFFTIRYLLSRIEKSAFGNLTFVFTHSRGTFFKPGETLTNLKTVIDSMDIDIQCDKQNLFCVDNEAFRYLVANNSGMTFTRHELKTFSESWKRSRDNCLTLLKYVYQLKPHCILQEQSPEEIINEMKEVGPLLCHISIMLEINIKIVNNLKKYPRNCGNLKKISLMTIKSTGGKKVTVCTKFECSNTQVFGMKFLTDRKVCHQPCSCLKNSEPISICEVFYKLSKKCSNCNCFPTFHKQRNLLRVIEDEIVLNQADRDLVIAENLSLFEYERNLVLETLALFYQYKKNEKKLDRDYFKEMLEKEKNRDTHNGAMYMNLKKDYDACLKSMKKSDISVHNIGTSINDVYNTDRTGKILKTFYERQTNKGGIIRDEQCATASKTPIETISSVVNTSNPSPLPNQSSKYTTAQHQQSQDCSEDIIKNFSFSGSYDNVLLQLEAKAKSHRKLADLHGDLAVKNEKLHSNLLLMKQHMSYTINGELLK